MNCLSNRFIIEPAKASDGLEMLQLLEQTPFEGKVSLLYTRRPDAYQSFLYEGRNMEVSVCRDLQEGKIIAIGAYVIQVVYINNKEEQVAYIFGLKGYSDYLKSHPLLHRFYAYLEENLKRNNIRFCYTTILESNHYAQRLLEKKRRIMPHYEKFGRYETFAIRNTSRRKKHNGYVFTKASKEDLPEMVRFLNQEGSKCQFFPVVKLDDILSETFKGINTDSFYIVKQDDKIIAAGAIWDQGDYKQYIVQQYSGFLRIFNKLQLLSALFQIPSLPDPGQALKFYTLSRWAIKDNDKTIFNVFMDNLKDHTQDYPFMLIGVHESHPLRNELMNRKHIKYSSNVYLVDWVKKISPLTLLNTEMSSYIECGAL
ncbi:MAG: hypothetical protein H6755_06465 [Candidatus Omnitrophica bacterium]|nr:hypothetical protein [Candidatus Omnitrophota bacterium]MCB9748031.1 hypothetical protein [Candidatus Omnitrophota bacterium]